MRKIQLAIILFFIISCVSFGVYYVIDWKNTDHNAPIISVEEDILTVKASASDADLLAGVTAQDVEDGDMTDQIQVASMTPLINGCERTVQYIVFDSADQLATATRKIVYEDYEAPKIYLKEPLRFTVDGFFNEIENYICMAEDMIDGDLTSKMRISYDLVYQSIYGEIYGNSIEPGNYGISFQVSNSAGDTCILPLEMMLTEAEEWNQKIYPALSDYVVYTKVGETVEPKEYLIGLNRKGVDFSFADIGGISPKDVSIQSDVNYEEPGIYTITYSFSVSEGEVAVTTLYVVVEE